ncbi:hypothetical protein HK098_003100 [Nowakowskiella sp. JEL0407]|nr:hypothetical protein HK098_003100 [Nowakowskiella sp. JEL0407]
MDSNNNPVDSRKRGRTDDYSSADLQLQSSNQQQQPSSFPSYPPIDIEYLNTLSNAGTSLMNYVKTLQNPNYDITRLPDTPILTPAPATIQSTSSFQHTAPVNSGSTFSSPQSVREVPVRTQPPKAVDPKQPCNKEGEHVPNNPELAYVTDSTGIIVSVEDSLWNKFIEENVDISLSKTFPGSFYPQIIGRSIFEFISEVSIQSFFRHIMALIASNKQPRFQYQWFCDSPEFERKMSMSICGLATGAQGKLILWLSKILYEKPKKVPSLYMNFPELPISRTLKSPISPVSEVAEEILQQKIKRSVCTYCHRVLVSKKEINAFADAVMKSLVVDPNPIIDDETRLPIIGLRGKLGQHLFITPSLAEKFGKISPKNERKMNSPDHVWLTPEQYYSAFDAKSDNTVINYGICEICYHEIMVAFFPESWSSGMKADDGNTGGVLVTARVG